MGKNLCFRPDREFVDRLENYMAIHHIEDKSEAMRLILREWVTQKRDIETLRNYLHQVSPKVDSSQLRTCPMGQKFNNKAEQDFFCSLCKERTPVEYNHCQTPKEGEN